MKQSEIIKELTKLPESEILEVIEKSLQFIRGRFYGRDERTAIQQQLKNAAKILIPDYSTDTELTVFTAIDSEDFHE